MSNTVVLGGGATTTSSLLPPAIAALRGEYPAIRYLVKEAGGHQIVDDVAQGRIQVGIVTLPVAHDNLELVAARAPVAAVLACFYAL